MSKLTPQQIKERRDRMQEEARIACLVREQHEAARKVLEDKLEKDIMNNPQPPTREE